MRGPYYTPGYAFICGSLGMAFMPGQLIALITGEHKDGAPLLYSLSCSPFIAKQKPLIGPSH